MTKRFLLFLILIFSFFNVGFCFAQRELEVTYPNIPGAIRPVSTRALLPETIVYLFALALRISGLVVFGSLIYGGVRYLTSAGEPKSQSDARDQILCSFLGLAVLLFSYIFLNTINPQLVRPGIAKEIVTEGIVLCEDVDSCATFASDKTKYDELAKEGKVLKITTSVPHLRNFSGENYEKPVGAIYFFEAGEDLEVHLFKQENWIEEVERIQNQEAGQIRSGDWNPKSIKLIPKPPGVYLCCGGTYDGDWKCQGEERFLADSTASLPPECHDNVRGIKLKDEKEYMGEEMDGTVLFKFGEVMDWLTYAEYYDKVCKMRGGWYTETREEEGKKNIYCFYKFAAVLHNNANYKAEGEVFMEGIQNLDSDRPHKMITATGEKRASSVTVFRPTHEKVPFMNVDIVVAAGEGVSFFPDANYVTTELCPEPYGPFKYEEIADTDALGFNTIDYKINSLKMAPDKRYIAILFEQKNYQGRCEVFIKSDPDFIDNDIGKCGCGPFGWGCHSSVKSLKIYPTR